MLKALYYFDFLLSFLLSRTDSDLSPQQSLQVNSKTKMQDMTTNKMQTQDARHNRWASDEAWRTGNTTCKTMVQGVNWQATEQLSRRRVVDWRKSNKQQVTDGRNSTSNKRWMGRDDDIHVMAFLYNNRCSFYFDLSIVLFCFTVLFPFPTSKTKAWWITWWTGGTTT